MSPKTDEEIREIVRQALTDRKVITIRTYYLSDYGQTLLKNVCHTLLEEFGRSDMMDIVYPAAKELVLNATKSNYKRLLFEKLGLDPGHPEEYEQGMKEFKENLNEAQMEQYGPDFKKFDLPVMVTFYYKKNGLNIKVKNNFPLLPIEEQRIREKFKKAKSFTNLIDFYTEHGDQTEGAGLGITMVGILLDQTGIDKHSFSLYSSQQYQETQAKLELPLSEDFEPKRQRFERELATSGMSREEFRKVFK